MVTWGAKLKALIPVLQLSIEKPTINDKPPYTPA